MRTEQEIMSTETKGTVYLGDAFTGIQQMGDKSVDAIITDPPYFLDGMGDSWEETMVERKITENQVITSLRGGMKFNKQQGIEFQKYMNKLAEVSFPKLKPGGWLIAFSAPRLYHRLAVGVEDAGYEIRDMWEWLYTQNQMKAMGLMRRLEKDKLKLSNTDYEKLADELLSWKTPQVKSCFEPIVLAQKPREGTFYENWKKYHIGLVNVKSNIGTNNNMSTSNVLTTESINELLDQTFLVGKPTKTEKGVTTHLSVKPLTLMKHIIVNTVPDGGLIVDPFNGSGTTGIAAVEAGRNFIGFENNKKYYEQSLERNSKHFNVDRISEKSYEATEQSV